MVFVVVVVDAVIWSCAFCFICTICYNALNIYFYPKTDKKPIIAIISAVLCQFLDGRTSYKQTIQRLESQKGTTITIAATATTTKITLHKNTKQCVKLFANGFEIL